MPGPWQAAGVYDGRAFLAQDHRLGRGKFRAGGPLPFSAEELPAVWGFPPNLAHGDDPYQSLIPYLAAKNADGLAYSLTGARLDADLSVTEGHAHDTEETLLDWIQIASCVLRADRGSLDEAGAVFSTDTDSRLALTLARVPDGATEIWARVKATAPSPEPANCSAFVVTLDLYGDGDTAFAAPLKRLFYFDFSNGQTYVERWLTAGPIDISGLSFAAAGVQGVVGIWKFAFLAPTEVAGAAVWEVQLGLRSGA
jgi:hypothetical protein